MAPVLEAWKSAMRPQMAAMSARCASTSSSATAESIAAAERMDCCSDLARCNASNSFVFTYNRQQK